MGTTVHISRRRCAPQAVAGLGPGRPWCTSDRRTPMTRISEVERPGLAVRALYRLGRAMYGRVPTPERLMAHRVPLMMGLGGLYLALEWFGRIESSLRALLNVQVAALYGSAY